LGIPALRALRARYPSAALHLVGPLPQARLALHAGVASTLTSVDAPALAPLFQDNAGLAGVPAQFRDLDAAVVWLGDPAAVAANLRRLGAGAIVAAAPFPEPGSRVHVADRLLGTLDPLDVPAAPEWDAGPWLQASAEARRWASEWIAGRVGAAPFIVLHPGSGSARKNWPAAAWAQAVDLLRARHRLPLLVTAGPADEAALAALDRALSHGARRRAPWALLDGAGLPQLAAVLERAAVYLGNDSGVTHLAAALGTPSVAVFGPTDPAVWRPRGPCVRVLGGVGGGSPPSGAAPGAGPSGVWPAPAEVARAAGELLAGAG
jgi:ADP-heptose:LPS heptosyltransferase